MPASDYDSVNVYGFLNYSGNLGLVVNTPSVGTFDLFYADSFNGNFSNVSLFGSWNTGSFTENLDGSWSYTDTNNTYTYDFVPSTGMLDVIAAPEPSTYALLGMGTLALLFAYRRRVM